MMSSSIIVDVHINAGNKIRFGLIATFRGAGANNDRRLEAIESLLSLLHATTNIVLVCSINIHMLCKYTEYISLLLQLATHIL